MKKLAVVSIAVLFLTSCIIEERGGRRYHHFRGWGHHRGAFNNNHQEHNGPVVESVQYVLG